ncbi:MAG: ATP-binding cassette domain-containing protein, partial [Acidimicrobiales bacterium]
AGKTTTFNACSGLIKPTSGRVLLHGADVTTIGPAGRSRLGLGRTFQRAELFDSLTVRENVAMGREAFLAGSNPRTQLTSNRRDDAAIDRAVAEAIEVTDIGPLADVQAGLLPTGQRRMVELARVLAGPFSVLLLDEPSAGLDGAETQRFGQILQAVVAERGLGILLVEHDMELVRQVCQNIFVLDFGRLIFEGTSEEMLASSTVRAAYLGSEGSGEPVRSRGTRCSRSSTSRRATATRWSSGTSRCASPTPPWWRCWARTVPARQPCYARRQGSYGPPVAPSGSTGRT